MATQTNLNESRMPESFGEFWAMHCKERGGRYVSFETSADAEDIATAAWDMATRVQRESMNETGICGKHPRRYWVEVVAPDPDHAPADNPNHVSVASYCALCVNERLIEERKRKLILQAIECPSCHSLIDKFPDEIQEVITHGSMLPCPQCKMMIHISLLVGEKQV